MFRFFVDSKEGEYFVLNKDNLNHIKVARIGDKKFICIYDGKFYICKLESNKAKIIEPLNENHEHEGEVVIAASYIDTKRFEWLIQKASELGATRLIPVISKNISKKLPVDIDRKITRWNQIALNASEQSFRNFPLIVNKPMSFLEVCTIDADNKYIAHEKEQKSKNSFIVWNKFLISCWSWRRIYWWRGD